MCEGHWRCSGCVAFIYFLARARLHYVRQDYKLWPGPPPLTVHNSGGNTINDVDARYSELTPSAKKTVSRHCSSAPRPDEKRQNFANSVS